MKKQVWYTELNERVEDATSGYSIIDDSVFILCLCLNIVTSDQDVWFMNFQSQIFFNNINHGYRVEQ